MRQRRRTTVLGDSQCLNRSSFSTCHGSEQQNYLKVKEKLAQLTINLGKKDQEIQ